MFLKCDKSELILFAFMFIMQVNRMILSSKYAHVISGLFV